ncbi:MAG: hypothetical protein H6R06_4237 [Proteobacteria bacterium]|jgi:hypothetical protein|nr:hypothetical protein [Pseudomonadota bacterium]
MSKDRATVGTDGQPLPILPPERDARVWARACRIMFYTPGFLALLLLKVGEPAGFGISIELLMLASMSAVVAVIFMGSSATGTGADASSRTGVWSGALVLELLAVVPLLTAVPSLFHELANSKLLHDAVAGGAGAAAAAASAAVPSADVALGASELIPAAAILPFMLYQLAGYGTLHFVLPKAGNLVANLGILVLIVAAFAANRAGNFGAEKLLVGVLIAAMIVLVFHGVLKLRRMQQRYDDFHPDKATDKKAAA